MRMNKEVVMVRITDIVPNRFQPRLTFDEEALNELSESIKEHGIIQPLILRDLGDKYEIIAGERRYKAATLAGLNEVPAIIGSMDDQTSAELALIENIQRKDLSAIEEAKSYKKILEMGNFTQEELAKRMGKSQSTIANKMRLLSLTNEAQVALMNNLISERHARCLLQIKDEDLQKEVLNKVMLDRMNVRDTDEYIKNILGMNSTINKTETKTNIEENKPEEISNVEGETSNEEVNNVIPEMNTEVVSEINTNEDIPEKEENTMPETIDLPEITKENTIVEESINDAPQVIEPIEESTPDVYADNSSSDFVNIANLSEGDYSQNIEEEPVVEEDNYNETVKHENDFSLIKLATAIRLAKDTVEDIKTAGYDVKLEEQNNSNNYEIIIKIEK